MALMVARKNSGTQLNKDRTKGAVDALALAVDNSGMKKIGDTGYFSISPSTNGILCWII